MTFVSCSIVSPQNYEISCVCHSSSFKIVLLHFQPVTLARFVDALRERRGGEGERRGGEERGEREVGEGKRRGEERGRGEGGGANDGGEVMDQNLVHPSVP